MLRKLLHTALLLAIVLFSYADEKSLDKMVFNAAVVNNLFPQERVYLHFDNSAYYLGETMWFKVYVTSGLADEEKPQSRVLYVELCAPEGYVVETKKYKLDENGRCNGEFELRKEQLSGYYEVRAYTRYTLNWGEKMIFRKNIQVCESLPSPTTSIRQSANDTSFVGNNIKIAHSIVPLQFTVKKIIMLFRLGSICL